jgi:hypothetical protein
MSIVALIVFGVILLLITLYIIFYVIYPSAGNNDILSKITTLNVKKDILTSDITQTTLLSAAGSTVMGFFYLYDGDRTAKYVNGFTPIIQVDNNWHLEIAPAPIGGLSVSARLRVHTNDTGTLKEENIDLPPIPKQKWMFVAILRDGRRFDIIYNNEIVASHTLEFYPVVISSPLSIGNSGLNGSVIHVIINNKRLSPIDVERERVTHIDTNGTVLEADSLDISFPGLKLLAQCPSGLPCDPVTRPPNNNLLQWKTPYA